ncbi:MAG: hypothetical protein M1828_004320 [Chrysothrix sp. TS-e1954]|nr:MAG: hypothetical protein M1828_004320 [Chrysothrix sp. TS-e1954]
MTTIVPPATSSKALLSSNQSADDDDDAPYTRKNPLRYAISAREYELLRQYLVTRSSSRQIRPSPLEKTSSNPSFDSDSTSSDNDGPEHNASTIRLSTRVFLTSYAGLTLYDALLTLIRRNNVSTASPATSRRPFYRSPNFKLSLSLSSILLFHRLLRRFFTRLRTSLLSNDAVSFRRRNPLTSNILTSTLTPAVGASLSGLLLGLSAADQTRLTITIYALTRSLEFLYNYLDIREYTSGQPSWLGSWLLMPLATGQLLHAFVFDRDCFPETYGSFILKRSPQYIQTRPLDYPPQLPWPSTFDIVDSLGRVSALRWPAFISPVLIPKAVNPVAGMGPLTDGAHPGIKLLSCAILHPSDTSCGKVYVKYFLEAFPAMAKFFTAIYAVFALPRWRSFVENPLGQLNKLAARVLRTSLFLTSAIGTAWGSICMLQRLLPGSSLPTQRWFLSGFLAGLWAWLERKDGRGQFLYSARMSLDSLWKVGRKRGWWKGVRGGDVVLFAASLALVNMVYEREPRAVDSGLLRKTLGSLRGEGWVDRTAEAKARGADEKGEKAE